MKNGIIPEIVDAIRHLSPYLQKQFFACVEKFEKGQKFPRSSKSLLDFAGSIPEEELKIMSEAIGKDCARIDRNE
jgi:hypothetical protein